MENQVTSEQKLMLVKDTILNNRYIVKKHIYSRNYSFLYEAEDIKSNEKVFVRELFVKSLFVRLSDGKTIDFSNIPENIYSDYVNEFEKGANALNKVDIPYVATITNIFRENGTSYYVMKYIEGELLSERITRINKPLTESCTINYLTEILDALSILHSNGFLHLDPTPSSIMIDKENHVKLIDFGHCKLVNYTTPLPHTNIYDPKELVNHDTLQIGPWTDFYILGATFYNLLTGKDSQISSKANDSTNKTNQFPSNINKNIQRLILWMLSPNIFKRPQDVNEIYIFIKEMQGSFTQRQGNTSFLENIVNSTPNNIMSIDNSHEEIEEETQGNNEMSVSNKHISKATQILLFVALSCIAIYIIYIVLFNGSSNKGNDRNEINIKKGSINGDIPLVDSTRTDADIFQTNEENKEIEKEKIQEAVSDTAKKETIKQTVQEELSTNLPEPEKISDTSTENKENNKPSQNNVQNPDNSSQLNSDNSNQNEQNSISTSSSSNSDQNSNPIDENIDNNNEMNK